MLENISPEWKRRIGYGAAGAAVIAAFVYVLSPSPIPVDLAAISKGPLSVRIEEEGKTRIKDVFVISAPTSGRVLRSPLEIGDKVEAKTTTVAAIEPSPPPFLDLRSQRELTAQIEAARANVSLAKAEVLQAEAELDFAKHDLERAQALAKKEVVSERALERAKIDVETRSASVARAKANQLLSERQLESSVARLTGPTDETVESYGQGCCIALRSPVSGRILEIHKKSQQVVPQGTPLVEIGDPANLEIVVELLSADAVKIRKGMPARISAWGGIELDATVTRVEPAGFTKVSALGIEEQRVRTIFDFAPEVIGQASQNLGHGYRVFTSTIVEDIPDAVLVPLGALFRDGNDWAVYAFKNGYARLQRITLGHRNTLHAAVEEGLSPGDQVILHPSDRVEDGARVIDRTSL
ncbi:MAG: HlyD family efflux transporter periplasmic adaptor subunit [Pseudomonadota bacterium]